MPLLFYMTKNLGDRRLCCMYFFGVVWEPIKMVYDMLLTRTPKRERREKMASSTENS